MSVRLATNLMMPLRGVRRISFAIRLRHSWCTRGECGRYQDVMSTLYSGCSRTLGLLGVETRGSLGEFIFVLCFC